jgi:bifunctional DNA-binding transcriptional regulator/antitoxin component of YhaV-PrlF toxin-antitoxin module
MDSDLRTTVQADRSTPIPEELWTELDLAAGDELVWDVTDDDRLLVAVADDD